MSDVKDTNVLALNMVNVVSSDTLIHPHNIPQLVMSYTAVMLVRTTAGMATAASLSLLNNPAQCVNIFSL